MLLGRKKLSNLLLVEDNPTSQGVMARLLGRQGFRVLTANHAEEAIALASIEQPDMILMDLRLPGISGFEATRRLRALPSTCHIPVIAISAEADAARRHDALEAGCDEFASKPFHLGLLVERMQTIWNEREERARHHCREHARGTGGHRYGQDLQGLSPENPVDSQTHDATIDW